MVTRVRYNYIGVTTSPGGTDVPWRCSQAIRPAPWVGGGVRWPGGPQLDLGSAAPGVPPAVPRRDVRRPVQRPGPAQRPSPDRGRRYGAAAPARFLRPGGDRGVRLRRPL